MNKTLGNQEMEGTGNVEIVAPTRTKSDLEREVKKYENVNGKLQKIIEEMTNNVKLYADRKVELEKLISQADKFYEKIFTPAKNKIIDPESGLSSVLNKSHVQQRDIVKNLEKINKSYLAYQEILKSINTILVSVKSSEKKINASCAKSEITKNDILLIRDSVKEIHKDVVGVKTQCDEKNQQIHLIHKESVDACKKIESNFGKSDSTIQDMVLLEAEARSFVDKIADQYGIASNTSLAGAFAEKKGELFAELKTWHLKVRNWSVILFVAIVALFLVQWLGSPSCDLNDLKFDFYLRFLFVTPLFFYLLFCTGQYNKTRVSLDKYSFKTAIARSLEAHTDLLSRNFSDPAFKDRVLGFSLSSLSKIYDKPYVDDVEMTKALSRNHDNNKSIDNALIDLLSFDKSETLKLLKSITAILEKKI